MGRFALILGVALFGFARQAYAFCMPGEEAVCYLNGKEGIRICSENAQFGPCLVAEDPPPPAGIIQLKYKVLTVIYAPPGKTGGGSTSSVSYGSSSSTGTTTSTKSGFKQSYAVSATASGGILGNNASVGLSFGYARNSVDSSAVDIKKSTSTTLSQAGPAADGIDHDRDQIWLWLKPKMIVTLPTPFSITWTPDPAQVMSIQFVFVGHLKNPALMPPGVKAQLDAAGLTTADYAEILEANPFANGDVPIDATRFDTLNTTFPYEPPFAPGDPSPTLNFTATRAVTSTTGTTISNEYKVGLTISGSVNFTNVFKLALKTDNSWTWTDETSRAEAIGSTESASVTIGGPSFGYAGPTNVGVYYDRIYKTFAFKFVPPSGRSGSSLEGVVVSTSDASVAGKEVVIIADGTSYRTFTNAIGEFSVPGVKGASTQLRVDGVQKPLARSSGPLVITVP